MISMICELQLNKKSGGELWFYPVFLFNNTSGAASVLLCTGWKREMTPRSSTTTLQLRGLN